MPSPSSICPISALALNLMHTRENEMPIFVSNSIKLLVEVLLVSDFFSRMLGFLFYKVLIFSCHFIGLSVWFGSEKIIEFFKTFFWTKLETDTEENVAAMQPNELEALKPKMEWLDLVLDRPTQHTSTRSIAGKSELGPIPDQQADLKRVGEPGQMGSSLDAFPTRLGPCWSPNTTERVNIQLQKITVA